MPLSDEGRRAMLQPLLNIPPPDEDMLREAWGRAEVRQAVAAEIIGPCVRLLWDLCEACRMAERNGDIVYLLSALEEAEGWLEDMTDGLVPGENIRPGLE